jgi:tetratricopeptide (TPR) repeat protein
MRHHDYEKEAALRERVRAEPACTEAHAELAAWLCRAGRLAQAKEALQTGIAEAGRPVRLHYLLGLVFAGAGDYASAERHLERAAQQEPGRFEFARDLALVQGAAGRAAASVETLRQAMNLGGDPALGLAWLLRLGERAMAESGVRPERRPPQPARRAALIERIVLRDPSVAAVLATGRTDLSREEAETLRAARRALARLASQHPKYPDIHFGLGLIAEQLGEMDRAIDAAEKAVALNPRYVEAYLLAARLYERSGQRSRAAERCRQASDLRPGWIDVHLRLGHLLREDGRPQEAALAYQRALAVDKRCTEARRGLEDLETARAESGPQKAPMAGGGQ